jgi:hypothetical protein
MSKYQWCLLGYVRGYVGDGVVECRWGMGVVHDVQFVGLAGIKDVPR